MPSGHNAHDFCWKKGRREATYQPQLTHLEDAGRGEVGEGDGLVASGLWVEAADELVDARGLGRTGAAHQKGRLAHRVGQAQQLLEAHAARTRKCEGAE